MVLYNDDKEKNQLFTHEFDYKTGLGLWQNDYTKEIMMVNPEQGIKDGSNIIAKKIDYDEESEKYQWKMIDCKSPKSDDDSVKSHA